MVRQHTAHGRADDFQRACIADPRGAEATAYRLWVEKVLQPLNERGASIIVEHIDLLDARHVVPELLQLVAHVASMRVCLDTWRRGELDCWSAISYPDTLGEYVVREFARIKLQQSRLLGITPRPPPKRIASKL
ncbi:hypothetical protein HT031_000757 [Scenedesmus sp. PABB004]|nr:hypothetical protein HT031_000757 [Scenedesmus sp. PABB004]